MTDRPIPFRRAATDARPPAQSLAEQARARQLELLGLGAQHAEEMAEMLEAIEQHAAQALTFGDSYPLGCAASAKIIAGEAGRQARSLRSLLERAR